MPDINPIPRAVIYARCSAVRQAEKELSIPAQLEACEAEARRRGWEIVETYIDEAESARSADRPRFQDMISAARKKPRPFEHILVWKFSRFSRSREDSVLYKSVLERAGVRLTSLNEPIDDSPAGRMLEGMLEVLDEFYSANLAEDTVRGMRKNASLGYWNGGACPTGYQINRTGSEASPKNVLGPHPVWAPVVQRMYRLALAGEGAASIAGILDGEGLRTPRGKPWRKQSILNILRNEVYTGTLIWGVKRTGRQKVKDAKPVRVDNAHQALVSQEAFDQVQALLAQRTRKRVHPKQLVSDYLLSGLMRCKCGERMIGHSAKNRTVHYYGCQARMKANKSVCDQPFLNRDEAERAVIDALRTVVLTPEHLTELVSLVHEELTEDSRAQEEARAAIDASLADAKRRLTRLYDALEQGLLDMTDLAPRIRAAKSKVDELTADRAKLDAGGAPVIPLLGEAAIRNMVADLHALLSVGSVTTRKAFLRAWVTEIDAEDRHLTVHYTLPPLGPVGGEPMALAAGAEDLGPEVPNPYLSGPVNTETGFRTTKAEPSRGLVLPMVQNGSR